MVLRCKLQNEKVEGLADLITSQGEVMREGAKHPRKDPKNSRNDESTSDAAERAWAEKITNFWLMHSLLSKFERNELRFRPGEPYAVTVIIKEPARNRQDVRLELDRRLYTNFEAICEIELTTSFETPPSDTKDRRGYYRREGMAVLVSWARDAWFIELQVAIPLANRSSDGLRGTLRGIARFVLDIIEGKAEKSERPE